MDETKDFGDYAAITSRKLLAWVEDVAAGMHGGGLSLDKDDFFYRMSYSEPRGAIKHKREITEEEGAFLASRFDFADFDLRTIFLNEGNSRGINFTDSGIFVGNVTRATEALSVYASMEPFVDNAETLTESELNDLHYFANGIFYSLARANQFAGVGAWKKEDASKWHSVAKACLVILSYQPFLRALVFVSMSSRAMAGALERLALDLQDVYQYLDADPTLSCAAMVFSGRMNKVADQYGYLFETESVDYIEDDWDEDEDEDEDEDDGGADNR